MDELRAAVESDLGRVAEIWQAGWREAHLGKVPEVLVKVRTPASFATRAHERVADTTVYEADSQVVGFVMVQADEVDQLYVAGTHRGSGIAARLLSEAERRVADRGHRQAWLAVVPGNARARRFYERHGWQDGGWFEHEAPGPAGSIKVPCHRYYKNLELAAHQRP